MNVSACSRFGVNLVSDYETSGRPGRLLCYVAVAAPDRATAVEIALVAARAATSGTEGRLLSEPRVTRAGFVPKLGSAQLFPVPGLLELRMSRRGA